MIRRSTRFVLSGLVFIVHLYEFITVQGSVQSSARLVHAYTTLQHFFRLFLILLLLQRGRATVFAKPAVTRDLFDVQMSSGTRWKANALWNTCVSLEFR